MKHLPKIGIALLLAFALATYALTSGERAPSVLPILEGPKEDTRIFYSQAHAISFEYGSGYYLKARDAGTQARPQLSVILVEDTQENRDVIEGRTTIAREGPTAITIDAYPNPDRLTAEDWVREDTNWTVRTSDAAPIGRGSLTGVTYTWSGLYEGKTVVVTHEERAYVFTVTWMAPTDPILAEFDRVLSSVELTP